MKINVKESAFRPVELTLESEDELRVFLAIMENYRTNEVPAVIFREQASSITNDDGAIYSLEELSSIMDRMLPIEQYQELVELLGD